MCVCVCVCACCNSSSDDAASTISVSSLKSSSDLTGAVLQVMHTEDSCAGSHGNLFPPLPLDGSSSAQGWLPDKGRRPCEDLEETSLCTELTRTVLLQGR